MSRKIEWTILDPNEIEHGPPKSWECEEGWESHVWQLAIEEGKLTLHTDCSLCHQGFWRAYKLAALCDWIDCPTCDGSGRTARPMGPMLRGMFLDPCPDCGGTGHPTIAQVLAWGEAVATTKDHPSRPGGDWENGWNACLDTLRAVKP